MNIGRDFRQRWITANAVFTAIGIALGAFHFPIESDSTCRELICGGYGFFLGAMTGAVVDFAQGYLLEPVLSANYSRGWSERRKAQILSWWLVATSLGFAVGHGLGDTEILLITDLPYSAVVYGIVSGLIIASLQSLVLLRYVSRAHWWIVGSTIGFTVGLALTGFLYFAVYRTWNPIPDSFYIDYPFVLPVFGVVQGVILGSVYALATHWSLRRTSHHPNKPGLLSDARN